MTYTYSVEDVIDAAMERNQMNDRTKLAGNAELILLCSRKQQKIFMDIAKVNPDYMGASSTINLSTYVADLTGVSPSIAVIDFVEVAVATASANWDAGDEIHTCAYREYDDEVQPKMYQKKDNLVGDSHLSGVTSVTIHYSILPAVLDSTASTSSVTFTLPDEHIGYMIAEMAYYLAFKDNRSENEMAMLKQEVEEERGNILTIAELQLHKDRRFN